MNATEIGRIEPGQTYRYHELRTVRRDGYHIAEDVELGSYYVEGFATDALTRRQVVVYRGLESFDAGKLFVCSLQDFATKFRCEKSPAEPPGQGAETPPEKVAGHASKGNPW